MGTPLPNPHRRNARKLGRGQYPRPENITANILNTGPVVTLQFSSPVIIHAALEITVTNRTKISQQILSPTRATITYNADVSGEDYAFQPIASAITSPIGADVVGETGTFMLNPNDVLHSAGGNYYPPPTTAVQAGVQFGVSNTGSTGSYAPAPPTPITILAITDNGDGTYDVQFSQPVTLTSPTTDAGFSFYFRGTDTWALLQTTTQIAADTIRFQDSFALTGYKYCTCTSEPTTMSAPAPFAASPLITIT